MRAQKEERRAVEKAPVREYLRIIKRISVEIWMMKGILMRSHTEMKNMVLGARRKKKNLAMNLTKLCLCSSALWKAQLGSNEIKY